MSENDLNDLVTEVRLIRTDMHYMAQQAESHNKAMSEVFDRLRKIENTIAILHAAKQPKQSAWTVTAVLVASLMALISFIQTIELGTL